MFLHRWYKMLLNQKSHISVRTCLIHLITALWIVRSKQVDAELSVNRVCMNQCRCVWCSKTVPLCVFAVAALVKHCVFQSKSLRSDVQPDCKSLQKKTILRRGHFGECSFVKIIYSIREVEMMSQENKNEDHNLIWSSSIHYLQINLIWR